MGLVKAALGAASGVMGDQWKEYFYCSALPAEVLAVKGQKKVSGRSSNRHGAENIIQSELLIKSPPSVRQILTVGLSLMRLFARPCGEPGIRRSFRMRIGLPYSDRTLESAKGG